MCRRGDPPYTFVTEGIERAVEQARTAAGEKNVALMGATIVQQCRPQPGGVEIRAGLHTGEAELFGAKLSAGSTGSRGASGAGRRIWAPMVSRRARTPLLTGGAATVDRAHRCRRTDRILQRADRTAPQRWGEKVERALPERLAPFR